ncbi:hypothetical protein YC2023_008891 [Brassica napus]
MARLMDKENSDGPWWGKFKREELKYTRPYLIEIMNSDGIQISNLTFLNSPSWHIHPVYSSMLMTGFILILSTTH